jgi:hypothetical protein
MRWSSLWLKNQRHRRGLLPESSQYPLRTPSQWRPLRFPTTQVLRLCSCQQSSRSLLRRQNNTLLPPILDSKMCSTPLFVIHTRNSTESSLSGESHLPARFELPQRLIPVEPSVRASCEGSALFVTFFCMFTLNPTEVNRFLGWLLARYAIVSFACTNPRCRKSLLKIRERPFLSLKREALTYPVV